MRWIFSFVDRTLTAVFDSQTAIEAAKHIHARLQELGKSAADIRDVTIRTHEACVRIIDKQFKPMDNFADRDHCVQYMTSVMLVFNRLNADDYTDGSEAAASPLVESLRTRIRCVEDPQFTRDYHDPARRTIPNALTVTLNDGTVLDEVCVEAPLGHRLRREEAKPAILEKYRRHLEPHFGRERVEELVKLGADAERLGAMGVDEYVDLYVKEEVDWCPCYLSSIYRHGTTLVRLPRRLSNDTLESTEAFSHVRELPM